MAEMKDIPGTPSFIKARQGKDVKQPVVSQGNANTTPAAENNNCK